VSQRKIIWFGIFLSTFIYAVVLNRLSRIWPKPGSFDEVLRQPIPAALYVIALATFAIAFVIPRIIKHRDAAFITSLALFEACAIYGLLAAFLTQDWRLYLAPWVLALIGFASRFPSDERRANRTRE